MDEIKKSDILTRLNLKSQKYFLISIHREENVNSENFDHLIESIDAILNLYNLPIIISAHPRTQKNDQRKKVLNLMNWYMF